MINECKFKDDEDYCTSKDMGGGLCDNLENCIIRDLLEYCAELKEDLEEAESNIDDKDSTIDELESDKEDLEDNIRDLESDIEKLENEVNDTPDIKYYVDELYTDICLNHIRPHGRKIEEVAYELYQMCKE